MNLKKIVFLFFLYSSFNFLVLNYLNPKALALKAIKSLKQSDDLSLSNNQVLSNNPLSLENHTRFSKAKLLSPYQVLPEKPQKIPIGLWITLNKGWYSYWKNPGESGKALKIKWTLPKGHNISDFKWPLPERAKFKSFNSFLYKDDFLLIAEWSLPKKKPEKQTHIKAEVKWLICKEVCIPLQQEVHLKLPAEPLKEGTKNKERVNFQLQSVFEEWSEKIPKISKKNIIIQEKGIDWKAKFNTNQKLKLLDVFPLSNNFFSLKAPKIIFTENYQHSFHIGKSKFQKSKFQRDKNSFQTDTNAESKVEKKSNSFTNNVTNKKLHSKNNKTKALLIFRKNQLTINEDLKNSLSLEEKPLFQEVLKKPKPKKPFLQEVPHQQKETLLKEVPKKPNRETKKVGIIYTFQAKQTSILWFLILAFLGGIILNLMPCVLPIVFLKFSNTLEQAKQKTSRALLGNLFYSAGVISSFLLLAFLLILFKKGGESIGWGFQMQSPYFLLSIIFLFVLISFGFMGWFSVSLPSLPFFHRGQNNFKHFLTGVLSTTSASPCTAPFMGASIGYALSSGTFQVIMIFFFLGIGLSFPYLLLSVFPKWMKYVPTPGNWSQKLKHFMAFPMLATSAWLIHLFNKQKPSALMPLLLALLFIALGFWLLNNLKKRAWLKVLSFMIIILSLMYPFFHLYESTKLSSASINWKKFSLNKMWEIKESEQALFINFTADWCLTCKFNEQISFKNKKVIKFFKKNKIHSLKGDWTHKNKEITEVLNYYHRSGIPFYLYLPPGAELSSATVLPELLTPGLLLKYLNKSEKVK